MPSTQYCPRPFTDRIRLATTGFDRALGLLNRFLNLGLLDLGPFDTVLRDTVLRDTVPRDPLPLDTGLFDVGLRSPGGAPGPEKLASSTCSMLKLLAACLCFGPQANDGVRQSFANGHVMTYGIG